MSRENITMTRRRYRDGCTLAACRSHVPPRIIKIDINSMLLVTSVRAIRYYFVVVVAKPVLALEDDPVTHGSQSQSRVTMRN